MRISHAAESYEGIASINAVGMAVFESSGLRDLIDRRCRYDPGKRILSPGMVVKALIGPMFNTAGKFPLYSLREAYNTAPTDRLFGPDVEKDDLYDNALARGLDSLFDADLEKLFSECSSAIAKKYGFDSHVFHLDATDVSVTGMEHAPDKEGAAIPLHNGHPKDMRVKLMQYELQVATDSNRILRYMKPYSGNVSDCEMDSDTIGAFADAFPESERKGMIIVGDCKLPTSENIAKMIDCGFGFVSKCSGNFKDNAKKKIVELSLDAEMHGCGKNGLRMADFDMDLKLSKERTERLRFMAFRRDAKVSAETEKVRAEARMKADAAAKEFVGKRYRKRKDAEKAASKAVPKSGLYILETDFAYYESDSPYESGWWEIKTMAFVSEDGVRRAAERRSTDVLITNLGRAGMSNEKLLELYNHEYKVEQSFRLMKSGMGMDSVFLQTPSRENAMMFVISIAVLVSNIADAVFRRERVMLRGKQLTMHRLAYSLLTTNVEYSRGENTLRLRGPPESTDGFFEITDILQINPQYLLGYLSD